MGARQQGELGSMRRRLVLEAPVETADGLGGTKQSFKRVAALWAQLEWLAGTERWREGRPEQFGSHRITLRWRAGIDAGQRFRDGDRIYAIRALGDPDGSCRRLVCLAEEISR